MKAIPALSTTTQRLLLGTTLCLSVLVLAGCARHGAGLPPNLPAPLLPHHQLVIYAPHGWQCPVVGAASEGDLEDGEGKPLDGYDQPTTVMVKDTEEHGTWLALEVQSPGQKARWLRVPHSTAVPCLLADADALQRALDQIGKRLVFTPWKPACHELHIAGQALDALFIENSPGVLPKVTALALGPESATERAANKSGTALWLDIKKSGLAVRADVAEKCFSREGDAQAEPPERLTKRLRIPPGLCRSETARGRRYFECQTSLGVWTGAVSPTALDLRLVHRTLGDVHFAGAYPVSGGAFAHVVVSVTEARTRDRREQRIYAITGRAIRRALVRAAGDSVRVAPASEADVNYRVRLAVANVRIGELQTGQANGTSQYKVRDEQVPNPQKAQARAAWQQAQQQVPQAQSTYQARQAALRQAQQNYQNDQRQYQQNKQAQQRLVSDCRNQANSIQDANQRQIALLACNGGDAAASIAMSGPNHDAIDQAQQAVDQAQDAITNAQQAADQAQQTWQNTPDTITRPVMANWTYRKTVFSRSASATLQLVLGERGVANDRTDSQTVRVEWQDYQVQADPAHNVVGHLPQRKPMTDADALLPLLANRVGDVLAAKLKAAIATATMSEAKRAFRQAGNHTDRPGFEVVDALAFRIAGRRLEKAVLQGTATLGGSGAYTLPLADVQPGQCLLGVAAIAQNAKPAHLALGTSDGAYADLRQRRTTWVEICGGGPTSTDAPGALLLRSDQPTSVRWGLYRTSDSFPGQAQSAPTTPPSRAPLPPKRPARSPAKAPERFQPAASSPRATGCTKDADCKGARICQRGHCVNPPPKPATPPAAHPPVSTAPAAKAKPVAKPRKSVPPPATVPGDEFGGRQ